jgi:hypothetical protein
MQADASRVQSAARRRFSWSFLEAERCGGSAAAGPQHQAAARCPAPLRRSIFALVKRLKLGRSKTKRNIPTQSIKMLMLVNRAMASTFQP